MKKLLATLAVMTLPTGMILGSVMVKNLPAVELFPAQVLISSETRCFEDEPCWDCTTMGNRICGVTPSELEAELSESLVYNGTSELPHTL